MELQRVRKGFKTEQQVARAHFYFESITLAPIEKIGGKRWDKSREIR